MKRLVIALAVLSGCIPMRKTFVMRPEATVRVVDSDGAPITSASVVLVRNKYPYGSRDARWSAKTDAKGEVSFSREEETQTVYPLMMHGVPGYGFVVCADAPGYAGKQEHLSLPESGPPPPVVLKLVDGDRPCEGKADLSAPPKGKARVLGIERVDAETWKLDLVLRNDDPIAAGVTLSGLKIAKVVWQGEPIDEWRRATVQVRGPGEKVRSGDLLVRE